MFIAVVIRNSLRHKKSYHPAFVETEPLATAATVHIDGGVEVSLGLGGDEASRLVQVTATAPGGGAELPKGGGDVVDVVAAGWKKEY
jgi:hypothetical protein